jgi:hypothetical protein
MKILCPENFQEETYLFKTENQTVNHIKIQTLF